MRTEIQLDGRMEPVLLLGAKDWEKRLNFTLQYSADELN